MKKQNRANLCLKKSEKEKLFVFSKLTKHESFEKTKSSKKKQIGYPTAIIRAKKNDQVVAIPPNK